ncbi:CheY-like chemotaxis protein [Bradyrhizobium japonicum]|jgi:CheY-like chemotaxis protein|uniref:CheY-like chemotaxis protein n=1 Tax=Bradyrhizobium japonicum TaxID=375 RepID=A0ABV2RIX6_BRAJP|nr:CheY-like chemotaxis protein [Bradyrhizobium japonicum]MCP1794419.1 CheY-like chemotaxis protein [Bradyrhizobium japonicum]MCP1811313.1 CheY-like chemotaxis protein [Bradyrhizobium japonicum]MCP1821322.1 CheY-like chemotaxis protein [Bradyrhizobium japonicum]MCP1876357.1 CheY-like chemotaxis protein [Bradyrhizobium japonicum]
MTQASILLVEDEALIRMMLVEMVEELDTGSSLKWGI